MQRLGPGAPLPNQEIPIPWSAKLLPQMDRKGLWDQMIDSSTVNYQQPPKIEEYICPSDALPNNKLAALSYIVNSGMPDPSVHPLPSGVSASDLKANGICHDQRPNRNGPSVRPGADIKDGASTTFLLSENIHKDHDSVAGMGQPSTWLGPLVSDLNNPSNYSEMSLNPEQRYGFIWAFDQSVRNSALIFANRIIEPINKDTQTPASYGGGGQGFRYARPSSAHNEVFVVGYCDGAVEALNENIDYRVYQQLMTPNGAKASRVGQNDDLTGFMNPPLSDSDFK